MTRSDDTWPDAYQPPTEFDDDPYLDDYDPDDLSGYHDDEIDKEDGWATWLIICLAAVIYGFIPAGMLIGGYAVIVIDMFFLAIWALGSILLTVMLVLCHEWLALLVGTASFVMAYIAGLTGPVGLIIFGLISFLLLAGMIHLLAISRQIIAIYIAIFSAIAFIITAILY